MITFYKYTGAIRRAIEDWKDDRRRPRRIEVPFFFEVLGAIVVAIWAYLIWLAFALVISAAVALPASAQDAALAPATSIHVYSLSTFPDLIAATAPALPAVPTNAVPFTNAGPWRARIAWDAQTNLYAVSNAAAAGLVTNAAGIVGVRVLYGNEPGQYTETNTYVPAINYWESWRLNRSLPYYFAVKFFGCDGIDGALSQELSIMEPGRVKLEVTNSVARLRFAAGTNAWTLYTVAGATNAQRFTTNGMGTNGSIVDVTVPAPTNQGFFLIYVNGAVSQ